MVQRLGVFGVAKRFTPNVVLCPIEATVNVCRDDIIASITVLL